MIIFFYIFLSSYVGQPVDTLLHHLPTTDSTLTIRAADNPNIAKKLFVTYQNWYSVVIFVDSFHYMNPIDTSVPHQWNIILFKKETITRIQVYRGNSCPYGCDDD